MSFQNSEISTAQKSTERVGSAFGRVGRHSAFTSESVAVAGVQTALAAAAPARFQGGGCCGSETRCVAASACLVGRVSGRRSLRRRGRSLLLRSIRAGDVSAY